MISALSAYKAMIMDQGSGKSTAKVNVSASIAPVTDQEANSATEADLVDISSSQDVFSAVDSFFNTGKSNRFEQFHRLSAEDKEQFVQIVADLAKAGYMGYQELVVNRKVERHDLENKIGDQRIRGARVYDSAKDSRR